jgi:hypothetical protein
MGGRGAGLREGCADGGVEEHAEEHTEEHREEEVKLLNGAPLTNTLGGE